MSFLRTTLKQLIALVWMIMSSSLFTMANFSIIVNCMPKINSTRPVKSFTDHLSYMRFGLMKPDNAKEMKILFVSAMEMRISCITTIVLSRKPSYTHCY
jgi:hypothetical protein